MRKQETTPLLKGCHRVVDVLQLGQFSFHLLYIGGLAEKNAMTFLTRLDRMVHERIVKMIRALLYRIRFIIPLGLVLAFATNGCEQPLEADPIETLEVEPIRTLEADPVKVMLDEAQEELVGTGPFSSKTAEILANRFGTRYVPDLIARLESPDLPAYGEFKICLTLGYIGDPRGRDAMIPLLTRPFTEQEISDAEAHVIRSASSGLGKIGDEKSLALLAEMGTKEYWASRDDIPSARPHFIPNTQPPLAAGPIAPPSRLRERFRGYILTSIALSKSPRARRILQDMRDRAIDTEEREKMEANIKGHDLKQLIRAKEEGDGVIDPEDRKEIEKYRREWEYHEIR